MLALPLHEGFLSTVDILDQIILCWGYGRVRGEAAVKCLWVVRRVGKEKG